MPKHPNRHAAKGALRLEGLRVGQRVRVVVREPGSTQEDMLLTISSEPFPYRLPGSEVEHPAVRVQHYPGGRTDVLALADMGIVAKEDGEWSYNYTILAPRG